MTVAMPTLGVAQARLSNPTISPVDYAVLIETSLSLVYRGLHDGSIPAVKLGQRFRIPSAWVRAQLHLPEPASA